MSTHIVRADWVSGTLFLLHDAAGFPVVMTQPQGVKGSDLLPMSLIGCAAWDVAEIMRKQRQDFQSLRVSAECEQDDEPPWRFRKIRISYEVTGAGLKEDQIRRAVALSESKYCSVYATLRDCVEISSEVVIREGGADDPDIKEAVHGFSG